MQCAAMCLRRDQATDAALEPLETGATRGLTHVNATGGGNPSRPQAPYAELNLLAYLRLKVCSQHAHGPWATPKGRPADCRNDRGCQLK